MTVRRDNILTQQQARGHAWSKASGRGRPTVVWRVYQPVAGAYVHLPRPRPTSRLGPTRRSRAVTFARDLPASQARFAWVRTVVGRRLIPDHLPQEGSCRVAASPFARHFLLTCTLIRPTRSILSSLLPRPTIPPLFPRYPSSPSATALLPPRYRPHSLLSSITCPLSFSALPWPPSSVAHLQPRYLLSRERLPPYPSLTSTTRESPSALLRRALPLICSFATHLPVRTGVFHHHHPQRSYGRLASDSSSAPTFAHRPWPLVNGLGSLTSLSALPARHRQLVSHHPGVQQAHSVAQPLTYPSADDDSQLPEGPYSSSTHHSSPDVSAHADPPPVTTRRATQRSYGRLASDSSSAPTFAHRPWPLVNGLGSLTSLSALPARHRQLVSHHPGVQQAHSVAQPLTYPSADDDSQLPEGPYSSSTHHSSPDVSAHADPPPVTTRRATQRSYGRLASDSSSAPTFAHRPWPLVNGLGSLTSLSALPARHRQLVSHHPGVQQAHSVAQPLTYPSADDDSQLPEGPYSSSTHHSSPDVSAHADPPPITLRRPSAPKVSSVPFPILSTFRRFSSACLHRLQTNVDRIERILGSGFLTPCQARHRSGAATSGLSRRLSRRLSGRGPIRSQVYHRRVFPRVVRSWHCHSVRLLVLRLGNWLRVSGSYTITDRADCPVLRTLSLIDRAQGFHTPSCITRTARSWCFPAWPCRRRRHRTRAHRSGPGHRVRVLREAMQRVLNNSVYTLLSRETRALRGVAAVDWGLRTEDALLYRIGKFRTGGGSRCQLADLAGARGHLTRPRVSLKGTDGYP